ncbi:MAG: MaoC/PaaZ C-terminal domain-containing protein [Pseudomonadota bacterium]
MPFNADLAGTRWGPVDWTFTPRRVLAYRAVLAPDDAAGLDDAASDGLFALPMQIVSPEWVLALAARDHPGQTLTAAESRRAVHAGQDSRFHRPVRAGETLTLEAELLGARAARAGVVAATRFTARDAAGALVAESLSTTVYRETALSAAASADVPSPEYPPPAPAAGAASLTLAAGFPHLYSECAEIWNPIHTERRVALAAGLPDIIVHGTALWALAGMEAARRHAGGEVLRLTRLAARFTAPALPGRPLTLEHEPADGSVRLRLRADDGRDLLTGMATFAAGPDQALGSVPTLSAHACASASARPAPKT